jgi:hypothetical protein
MQAKPQTNHLKGVKKMWKKDDEIGQRSDETINVE